jgi:hypothetical protein
MSDIPIALFRQDLLFNWNAYRSARKKYVRRFQKNQGNPAAVLTNFHSSPVMIALADAAAAAGIPFFAFQHGVTREICGNHMSTSCQYENGFASHFFAFNSVSAEISDRTPFCRGRTKMVGLPRHFGGLAGSRGTASEFPLLYISTAMLSGNINHMNGALSDVERTRREIEIIDKILSRLPHRTLFKTYPSRDRYPDPDPVHHRIAQHRNITLFKAPRDLRHLIARHRILITSRATSTVSWALASERPLIFIDMPDHSPLSDEAFAAFEAGVFTFRWGASNMFEAVCALLSEPLDRIETLWAERLEARQALIEKFFGRRDGKAGHRAAESIITMLRNDHGDVR